MTNELRYTIAGVITIFTMVVLGSLIWIVLQLRPVDHDSTKSLTFNLKSGTSTSDLADQLSEAGLIRDSRAFTFYVTITGKRGHLQAGDYELSPSNTLPDIAQILTEGKVSTSRLIVPDGVSIIALRKLADERGINLTDFDTALKATDYANDFLKVRPPGSTLEGYLYPDSYEIIKPVRTHALVQSMLDNFGQKINGTDIVKQYAAIGLTLHQGVTLASIVEKEVPGADDRAMVSQVYLNRLKAGMPLQADPTVAYVAEATGQPFDTKGNSPYNTYTNKGLPPGPICNPSLSSMQAVAHPKANDYLYFIADKQGKTHYAKTFPEHQANVDKYLQ